MFVFQLMLSECFKKDLSKYCATGVLCVLNILPLRSFILRFVYVLPVLWMMTSCFYIMGPVWQCLVAYMHMAEVALQKKTAASILTKFSSTTLSKVLITGCALEIKSALYDCFVFKHRSSHQILMRAREIT